MSRKEGSGARVNKRVVVTEILAQLMWGSKSRNELSEAVELSNQSIDSWLTTFQKSGLIRICSWYRKTEESFKWYPRYELQTEPFALGDHPEPPLPDNKAARRAMNRESRAKPVAPEERRQA